MTQLELTPEQEEVLLEVTGSDATDLYYASGSKLHHCVFICDAWTDGSYLIFIDESLKNCQKFLYYLGVEKVAVLEAHFRGITIYGAKDDGLSDHLQQFLEG